MIETDHHLRDPTDMILLERVAKAVFHTDGIAQVQSITRPLGTHLTMINYADTFRHRRPGGSDAAERHRAGPGL
ncbi:hypothetical protein TUM20985_48870 [Mycobacterium antarcticum]|nr:hypothetical protein TUM20985_48870 [Mycolicibacterium sp. TUM20985]